MHFLQSIEQLQFSIWVRESGSIWAFPTILFLHTLGMAMVAGGNTALDLVLLGFWPRTTIRPLERLFPIMWWGFGLNAVTGTILLMADAATKLINPDFYVKMLFIFAGVWTLHLIHKNVFADPDLDKGAVSPASKRLAWLSLICWFAAITAGRLLAYVGPVSGLPGLENK